MAARRSERRGLDVRAVRSARVFFSVVFRIVRRSSRRLISSSRVVIVSCPVLSVGSWRAW